MLFGSVIYMIILPVILLVNRIIPGKFRYLWLLAVSCGFYFVQNGGFVIPLLGAIVITYTAGLLISLLRDGIPRKITAGAGITAGLAVLFLYKYLNFSLALCGSLLRFEFAIPLGISFYTFQAVSYIADVYRDRSKVEKNPLKLALFLSFFLSIVSGPVNRAPDMMPQFSAPEDPSLENIKTGMQKMLWGYFLKLAIAGRLAIVVDNVYGNTEAYSGLSIAFSAIAYLFMLYCDFEGYSQIVIGSGYMLGIRMKENFRQPFMSSSMGEVWRRWHVSLSTWFRDYVYIPLGGSRCSIARKYINVFITLFVSGIWHGANLTFFIWGALNGAYIIAGQITSPLRDSLAVAVRGRICGSENAVRRFDDVRIFAKRIGVYLFTASTFIFFANKNVSTAWNAVCGIFTRLFVPGGFAELTSLGLGRFNLALAIIMALFVLAADARAYKRSCDTPSLVRTIPTPVRWAVYYALLTAILFSANLSTQEFIYSKM